MADLDWLASGDEQFVYGTVKFFRRDEGWGFILPEDGSREVFVHFTQISDAADDRGRKNLYEGDRVRFLMMNKGRGPAAAQVVTVAHVASVLD